MEINSDTYELICEQLKQCLLPELDREIGNEPLVPEDFGIFRYGLEKNLQLLFDIIAKNERLVCVSFDNNDNTFRTHFILLLHQQSGHNEAPFQIGNESISKQIQFLIDKYYKQLISMPVIYDECLEYYKKRLTSDKWKRNIGAVYGYLQMYKLHQQLIETKLKADECLFMLSVGMLLVDYFEIIYKKFGLVLFNILLDFGNPNDIKRLNLYKVTYEKLMNPLINVIKDEITTVLLLTCLYKCIRQFNGVQNPSKWNEVDDVLEHIMQRIPFESDNRSAAILYLFVAKLTLLPLKMPQIISNRLDIENLDRIIGHVDKCTDDDERSEQYDKLRTIFQMHHNLPIARWSKKLLEVFTQRAIIGRAEEIHFQIHVLHICYLCCFYGNPLFVRMNWSDALHDIIKTMMELVANNINYKVFIGEIFELLKTYKLHLEHVNPRLNSLEAYKYDLDNADGRKQSQETEIHVNVNEIEQNVIEFRKSIDDIIVELKSHCEKNST